jgi:hypothetical protein
MTKKNLWLGMLVMALALGMTVVGCDDKPNDDPPMGPKWTMVTNPPFGTGNIEDIAFGDGKFIAVGYSSSSNSRIAYSTDGINWSLVNNLSPRIYPHAVAYGNGKWVTDNAYSTDGLNWNEATDRLSSIIFSPRIVYGGGKFIAIGSSEDAKIVAYSSDGQSWTTATNSPFGTGNNPDYVYNDIVYSDGKFIVVGADRKVDNTVIAYIPKIASSTDGINWTSVSPALFGNSSIDCIAYGGGKFVASNGRNATAYSLDGISWTPIITKETKDYGCPDRFRCIAYGNGKWIGLESDYWMAYSSDGINWTPAFNPPDISFPKAVYGNGKFVVIDANGNNGRIAYSVQ